MCLCYDIEASHATGTDLSQSRVMAPKMQLPGYSLNVIWSKFHGIEKLNLKAVPMNIITGHIIDKLDYMIIYITYYESLYTLNPVCLTWRGNASYP